MPLVLADLSQFSGNWDSIERMFTTPPSGVIQICTANPNRWAIAINVFTTGFHQLSKTGEPWTERGVACTVSAQNVFEYSKLGAWIQGNIFFITANPIFNFGVTEILTKPTG